MDQMREHCPIPGSLARQELNVGGTFIPGLRIEMCK